MRSSHGFRGPIFLRSYFTVPGSAAEDGMDACPPSGRADQEGFMRRDSRSVQHVVTVAALAALLAAPGCGRREGPAPAAGRGGEPVTLILAAYTTPREAYGKAILPAFQKYWKEKTGQDVEFQESYQGSGAQARAIVGGFEADIAALSLEADVDKIAEAGLITHDWKSEAARRDGEHVDRRPRGPPGEPEGHQGLGRPGAAGPERPHARPEDLGRSDVEHQRDVRRGAARLRGRAEGRPRPRGAIPRERLPQRLDHGQGRARVHHQLREGRRRRGDHVRERGARRPARRARRTSTSFRARRS